MFFIYAIIVLIATTIGAIAGLGGGIIIKPLFDMLGYNDASTISVLSAFAVFSMSVISIIKQFKKDTIIKIELVFLMSFGSLMGGFCGETLFQYVKSWFGDDLLVKTIQSSILAFTLLVIIVYRINERRIKTHFLKNPIGVFLVGISLGTISIFLGIGGGPLNIIILSYLFSFEVKESVLYSIVMVFFAQISKLTQVYFTNHFSPYNFNLIIWLCAFAVIGGYIGSLINQKINDVSIKRVYDVTVIMLLLISIYNVIFNLGWLSR